MKFIDNIDYNNIDLGINQLKDYKFNHYLKNKNEIVIFHVYWYGNINKNQILCIKSYLASQNLNNTELWVWLDYETYNDNHNKITKHKNIKVKKYNPKEESKNTIYENKELIMNNEFLKFRSDIARTIFLYKYGGIYYDLDFILLKDLSCLFDLEFCYTWGGLKKGNNAILRIKKGSNLIKEIMGKYINLINKNDAYNKFWKRSQFRYSVDLVPTIYNNLEMTCFPSVMFDPIWILFDDKKSSKFSNLTNFDDFFKSTNENIDNFFDNQLFGYHWHSRSNISAEKDSYFYKIEKKIDEKIRNLK
tara:strand:+ start:411 stop:1322 length:912 start_codon:yes stop_codon:yes gene_type:complete